MKAHQNEQEAAEFLGVTVNTLQDWRLRRKGPVYCKFGRAVRYPTADLEKFAQSARIHPKEGMTWLELAKTTECLFSPVTEPSEHVEYCFGESEAVPLTPPKDLKK